MWLRIVLGDPLLAIDKPEQIKAGVDTAFDEAGEPDDMAVFTRYESGGLHCELCLYFTPAAASVARALNATPCKAPEPDGLSLLAGSQRALRLLFPEC